MEDSRLRKKLTEHAKAQTISSDHLSWEELKLNLYEIAQQIQGSSRFFIFQITQAFSFQLQWKIKRLPIGQVF